MNTEPREAITVTTVVNAPARQVWSCWTAPSDIEQWCFATPEWHAPRAENDLRVGGRFSTTMAAKDGSASFDFEGEYTEVNPQNSIRYEMSDGRRVHISFSEQDGRTTVSETFDPETQNPAEMQRAGWQAILDNFKKHVEASGA